MLEASKNRLKMMPKWIPNPSNIDEKSIENSRLEKGRPKIEKNRRLERPRVGEGAGRPVSPPRGGGTPPGTSPGPPPPQFPGSSWPTCLDPRAVPPVGVIYHYYYRICNIIIYQTISVRQTKLQHARPLREGRRIR